MKQPSVLSTIDVSRRKLLGGLTGVALAGGGLGYVATLSEPAQATVDLNNYTLTGDTVSTEDGQIADVWLSASCSYKWSTVNFEPTSWVAKLIVADSALNYDVISTVTGNTSGFDGQGSFDILGNVLAHPDFVAGDFESNSDGAMQTTEVFTRLRFEILVDMSTLADALLEESATVSVENTMGTQSLSVELGADGELVVRESQDDPTPTV